MEDEGDYLLMPDAAVEVLILTEEAYREITVHPSQLMHGMTIRGYDDQLKTLDTIRELP